MRITNNMIMNNTKTNINGNKVNVNKYNNQMTTQKKISKASEDPVIAIRSLRLSTTLSHVDQYVDNNIPDADSWLDVTYTALNNMKDLVTDIRTQCVKGSTDSLTAEDRQTILKNLEALQDQIYSEGNADYAGRTVFTGYRTTENLTFNTDEEDTRYRITEDFTYEDLDLHRYYSGEATVPTNVDTTQDADGNYTGLATEDIEKNSYYRLRLAYDEIEADSSATTGTTGKGSSKTTSDISLTFTGMTTTPTVVSYDNEAAWQADTANYPLASDSNTVVVLKSTGEVVMSDDVAQDMLNSKASMSIKYQKTGFEEGDLRPEYYFNCEYVKVQTDDSTTPATVTELSGTAQTFTLEDQPIEYTIANRTTLTINTQARDVFSQDIDRDVSEMIDAVNYAINAEAKVSEITEMMESEKYADADSQAVLQSYLDVAQKEADYANDNLQKLYESYIGNFDDYLTKVNIGITNVGSMQSRLELTENRVTSQQTTVEELKTDNEDRDLSDIIIDYYAANNAYTASLTAASKASQQSLLNYL